MRSRCNNPNKVGYDNYGGRGISYCSAWSDFWQFVEDMGDRPVGGTIERIDPDGNYEPSNCVWVSVSDQQKNRRNNKLNYALADEIRELYSTGEHTYRSLSALYGVNHGSIRDIIKGITWQR